MAESPLQILHKDSTYDSDIKTNQLAYTANGALTIQTGTHLLTKAGVLAATLAAPSTAQNGTRLRIISTTAQAHTVTQTTPGFNNGSTASDVATFGGAIGDNMTVEAYNGIWHVISLRNVTLG